MENTTTELTFLLNDERTLGYALYGPQNGKPVLYFHGTPSSRLEPQLLQVWGLSLTELLHQYNIQLIAVDRPGMGLSSIDPNRTYTSFAQDAHALLQHLNITRCSLFCWSGGGPYALTLVQQFAASINKVCMVAAISCSFGDAEVYAHMGWNKMYFNSARYTPLLLKGTLEAVKRTTLKSPFSQSLTDLSDVDYALLRHVDHANGFLDLTIKEASRESNEGPVQEATLYFQPFPYTLADIKVPVHFWWGSNDNVVTYIHAKTMEQQLPQVTPHYKMGEGHLSVYINYCEEVLQVLAGE